MSKRRGLFSSGVLLQRDNARPHSARSTAKKITDLRLECIPHPAYSLDLALSDYHVFGPLKKFSTDDDIKEAVHRWLRSQSEEFFSRGIQALVKSWHTCIERGGDYVEK
jgi:histone-lysine N-methyltransferase SETMAR